MIKVVVIGSSGLVGNAICEELIKNKSIELHRVNRKNINSYENFFCDVLINSNGSSRKGWCNENKNESFKINCMSFYNYMDKFTPERYILISSIDVYSETQNVSSTKESCEINPLKLSIYGFHKYITESLVEKHYSNHLILRLSAVISLGLKKNALYDITRKRNLLISPVSNINFIDANEVAKIVSKLLVSSSVKKINCASSKSIRPIDIIKLLGYESFYDFSSLKSLPFSSYEISIKKLISIHKVKTSLFYVNKYIKDLKSKKL